MTPDEKENMQLTIENAMLKGFEKFAEAMKGQIASDIKTHADTCTGKKCGNSNISFMDVVKNWKTIAAAIIAFAWICSSFIGSISNNPIKPETERQLVQIIKHLSAVDPNLIREIK